MFCVGATDGPGASFPASRSTPFVAVGAVIALAAVQGVLARTRPPRAVIVGVQQLLFGLAVVITAGLALVRT